MEILQKETLTDEDINNLGNIISYYFLDCYEELLEENRKLAYEFTDRLNNTIEQFNFYREYYETGKEIERRYGQFKNNNPQNK